MTNSISVEGVSKYYGDDGDRLCVFDDVTFGIDEGEFVVVVGPSGCGKTTLLKMIAGIVEPSSGTIHVDDQPVDGPSSDVAMVFQDFVLLPWNTVLENVAVGLKIQESMSTAERQEIARRWLERVGLEEYADSYPSELSGGMQQRVGLARALAVDPGTLLMDEPFGSLDAQTKHELQTQLLELWSTERKTILFVTHDIDEAIYLADRILVLSSKPARVMGETTVDIDRPRWTRRLEVEGSDEFTRAKQYVYDELGLTYQ
jgi:NitT/TauT family transport system ATP-binding protein